MDIRKSGPKVFLEALEPVGVDLITRTLSSLMTEEATTTGGDPAAETLLISGGTHPVPGTWWTVV